ncbi:PQQ-dependent sugar dehydrogenase [Colwellia sp. 1_MG-2023]|uniref:PQQ-dependent sugar dehydrogenase n=1 Tax=Colwellia sp. 1_MG-2023 TaxID=3062649 RepID=UPI0026E3122B|nr:PQQ-dependent sugar dehydrogenase [Colwellia sp. 1_MG-2023]MDO6444625.1 PQQ-dependent sugar dehydrogenase [Colwellia sp. 1_MG-2023]
MSKLVNSVLVIMALSLTGYVSVSHAFDSHPLNTTAFFGKYKLADVNDGFDIPWGMVQLPNQDILVSERRGELRVIHQGKLLDKSIQGLPKIDNNGQGGLLDLALDPDFINNSWLYFTYADDSGDGRGSNTALMRAKLNLATMSLSNQTRLYKGKVNSTKGQHYGSRIAFDEKGYVYFSIGDRGRRDENPQDLKKDGGKIYRLHKDGSIPSDNPFLDENGKTTAVFSYGHRNPQGLAFDTSTGVLWSHEHGPKGGDEINVISAGKNYGWPVVSYGVNYSGTTFTELTEKKGMANPALYWLPSIAPSAMIYITSDKYPQLKGKLLLGSMKFGYIVAVSVTDNKVEQQFKLFNNLGRVRSLMQGVDGFIYVGLDGGGIKKLLPIDT